jgi:hypothetical protein
MKIFIIGGVACAKDDPQLSAKKVELKAACESLGASIASPGNTIVVCSPFDDSADSAVLRGVATHPEHQNIVVEFHFVDSPPVREKLAALSSELNLQRIVPCPHPPPASDSPEARQLSWLVCQLSALESAHVTFAIGGDPDGSANMLLLVAEGRRKPLLPFPFLGGAAQRAFERRRFELEDRLRDQLPLLLEPSAVDQAIRLADQLLAPVGESAPRVHPPRFFISYPRARQAEADHVETVLRRRNLQVFRDESDFGAGHELPGEIREGMFGADIFIAIWCAEYACSPWCFDEMELALDRQASKRLKLWIFCVDDTRMVPTRARNVVYYEVRTRQEIEGKLLDLVGRELA